MNTLFENIPRLGELKTKPKIGEIRLTIDGTRRKIFDGNCWQYLCIGDPNCRVQSKNTCRYHRMCLPDVSEEQSLEKKSSQIPTGEIQMLPNGSRRIWRGTRWHSLCRVENCVIQAKDFCKNHQNQRMSLSNTNLNSSPESHSKKPARSLVTQPAKESISDSLSTEESHPIEEKAFESVAISPTQKRELHTRNGRRVRCNGLIWKHLCAEKKTTILKRKYQRRKMIPLQNTDPIPESNPTPSDTPPSSIKPVTRTRQKRKITPDISNEEHIVPKRQVHAKRRKASEKSIRLSLEGTSSNTSVSDIPLQENSMEEPVLTDSDISLTLKPNRLQRHDQSIEIPIQSPSFSYDSSTSAIIEQFGTIIKKEAIIEDETIICVPSLLNNQCETLQDFLRIEEMKTKEFQLDCQRISYRLAKIQDCIGSMLN